MTLRCAVVGATGLAGQQFLVALANHPFFEVARLAASSRSAGKRYRDALTGEGGGVGWYSAPEVLEQFQDVMVEEASEMSLSGVDLVFSALETEPARTLEAQYAEVVPVISTASAYRMEPDVPLLIPAVNGDHAELIRVQKARRGWKGFVAPIPNCTTTGLAIALAPLEAEFGVERVVVTSMQAVSGAGRSPGVIALDITDNVIPFIPKEEEKVERETKKLLGKLEGDRVEPSNVSVSATCTRVAVLEGHTESVAVALRADPSLDEARAAMTRFGRDMNPQTHPSAPDAWITVFDDPFRPQVRKDRDLQNGMTTSVGRLREETVLGEHGVKFVLVSHNTKMGAAQGAVLVAEDLRLRGFLA